MFVGIGLFLFGVFFLGSLLKGVGALVAAIGVGQVIAGYLYPNTSGEINKAVEDLINLLDERKKEPIDYRRTGVVTLFVGIGLFLFGVFFLGSLLKGVGALVAAIGVGQVIAGYLYPNTSEEINKAVEEFEKS